MEFPFLNQHRGTMAFLEHIVRIKTGLFDAKNNILRHEEKGNLVIPDANARCCLGPTQCR